MNQTYQTYPNYPTYISQPIPFSQQFLQKPIYKAKFKKGTLFHWTLFPDERITDITYEAHCSGIFKLSGQLHFTLLKEEGNIPCHISNVPEAAAEYFIQQIEETGFLDLTESYCGALYYVDK